MNKNDVIISLMNCLNDFLNYYEYYDYYLNFVNQEGAYMNISRLINENFYKEKFNYERFNQKYKLRNELIKISKYDYINKKGIKKIDINSNKKLKSLLLNTDTDEEETKKNSVIFNNKNKGNNIFLNNYNDIENSLKTFLFEGYDDKRSFSSEEYYNDLLKLFPLN